MKQFSLYFFVLLLFIFSSCKDNDLKPSDLNIEGKWELEAFRGSWVGGNYPPGTGPVLVFKKKTYQEFKGDTLLRSGSFKIVKALQSTTNRKGDKLDWDNGMSGTFISLHENYLILSSDFFDAPSYKYRRID